MSCSNEDILQFLDYYRSEPCIWDPMNKDHKDKTKVADAWIRLGRHLNKPIKELKNKKEILMVTFRKNFNKKQESMFSGIDDIYKPSWFAYEFMESFLLPVYNTKIALNIETQSRSSETAVEEIVDEADEAKSNISLPGSSTSVTLQFRKKCTEKRHRSASYSTSRKMTTAFSQLNNLVNQSESLGVNKVDECDLYAMLLSEKIRQLPEDDRKLMMYEIDGLFVKRIKNNSFMHKTPSP